MVVDRRAQSIAHHHFHRIPQLLQPGDLLVLNDTKVIPARLWARKSDTGGQVELLLLNELATNRWRSLARPAKRLRAGTTLAFDRDDVVARIIQKNEDGSVELKFEGVDDVRKILAEFGEPPLPPYIERKPRDRSIGDSERYQTVYARREGAVAAPTAGLHFTQSTLEALRNRGIETCFVTLDVGLGTFLPVKTDLVEDHKMHAERFEITQGTVDKIHGARSDRRRIVAVGTTSLRVLETVAESRDEIRTVAGETRLFIYPPYKFKIVDALITNFHLPQSTLLMLVSAFAGKELIWKAYQEAIREKYRFYSYGDCMLIV